MIDENKYSQYGVLRPNGLSDIKAIIIHNTNNYSMSARQLHDYLNNECKDSTGCNYIVDKDEVVQVVPDTWGTYNSGKGEDFACVNGIAIEICSNLDNTLYKQGQDKAISFIKELMEQYNLTNSDIYFHSDFADYYCPATILDLYGNKRNFIREEF